MKWQYFVITKEADNWKQIIALSHLPRRVTENGDKSVIGEIVFLLL